MGGITLSSPKLIEGHVRRSTLWSTPMPEAALYSKPCFWLVFAAQANVQIIIVYCHLTHNNAESHTRHDKISNRYTIYQGRIATLRHADIRNVAYIVFL